MKTEDLIAAFEVERFEKAVKVAERDYEGGYVYFGDTYYASIEVLRDYLDADETVPLYVWACKGVAIPKASIEDVIDNILDNMWEDADPSDLSGVDELEAAIEAFNEANRDVAVYGLDYSIAILLDAASAEVIA